MINLLSLAIIVLSGLYLLWLAWLSFAAPVRAARFLSSFASSARAHYLELFIRLVVGASLLLYTPQMQYPNLFRIVGWVLIITTLPLLAVPWRWHQQIAQRAVPCTTGNLKICGLASALFGGFVLACVTLGQKEIGSP